MSGTAGLNTTIKLAGTPTAFNNEKMATKGSSVEFQINSTDKRLFDYGSSLTFTENSCSTSPDTISSTNIDSISRLFGIVVFNSQPSSAVEVSGKYLPLANIAGAHTKSVNVTKNLLDDTEFGTTSQHISRTGGLKDVNISVSRWDSVSTDFYDAWRNDTDVIVEVRPGGSSNSAIRGIFSVESENRSGDVNSLEEAEITLQLNSTSTAPPFDIRSI